MFLIVDMNGQDYLELFLADAQLRCLGLITLQVISTFRCIQDRIIIMASIIKANQLQDFGGNSILTSDGAGNLTTQKTNYPAFLAYLVLDKALQCILLLKLQFNTEEFDTDNAFDNSQITDLQSTGKAGKYYFIQVLL